MNWMCFENCLKHQWYLGEYNQVEILDTLCMYMFLQTEDICKTGPLCGKMQTMWPCLLVKLIQFKPTNGELRLGH